MINVKVVSPWAAGVRGLRKFWRSFLLIQSAAVLLVVAYHVSQTVRDGCAAGAAWKAAGGLAFAAATGAIAGGVLPEIAKWLVDRRARDGRAGAMLFNIAFFAVNGVVIDRFYSFEARLFGDDGHFA